MNIAIVTWEAGGVTQPAIGLARLLVESGHRPRVLAPAGLEARVRATGAEFRAWPAELEVDFGRGRAFEDQWPDVFSNLLLGPGLPAALGAELDAEPADAVVVDFMLRSALFEAERRGVPGIPLAHMPFRYHASRDPGEDPDAEWGWRWTYRRVNETRTSMGLEALPIGPMNPTAAMLSRTPATIVCMPPEFDQWPSKPASIVHIGPIFEESIGADGLPIRKTWSSPWTEDDQRPLVVVSLGTTYMYQEALTARLAEAAASVGARVLVLTGSALEPRELPQLPDGVVVRQYVPHAAVLPEASLLITHGGMGSLMASFAAGVPTICVPLGRDQQTNAELATGLGTFATLSQDKTPAEYAVQIADALASNEARAAARRMRAVVAGYRGGAAAVDVLEGVVSGGEPSPNRTGRRPAAPRPSQEAQGAARAPRVATGP